MSETLFAMLHPEPSLFLCTLQPLQDPSAPTIIADGHFLKPTTPHNRTHFLSSPILSFLFLSGDMQCSKFLLSNICINTVSKYIVRITVCSLLLFKCGEIKKQIHTYNGEMERYFKIFSDSKHENEFLVQIPNKQYCK